MPGTSLSTRDSVVNNINNESFHPHEFNSLERKLFNLHLYLRSAYYAQSTMLGFLFKYKFPASSSNVSHVYQALPKSE